MTQWINAHPWMTFWLVVLALIIAENLMIGTLRIVNRVLRSGNIRSRGWPPPHLDADGDWKPEPKGEEA